MRSKKERLAQAGLLELGGILLVAPLSALVTGNDLASMGSLAVVMSTLAVIWSTVWNWMFDRWVPTRQRSATQRIAQALGFELGLVLVTVFIVAAWLDLGLWQALLLDLGFVAFFLVWAMIFNPLFDAVMSRLLARKAAREQQLAPHNTR
ncbi:MAG: transmembrane pair domain-containing protein [Cobetia sp.]|uniref:PACE efflux transporter n=1 Tax=unclassified Cobetia TaxID=2609414 RepID=UPI000C3C7BD9|nr:MULTISPECIES: PACE efflux transporter [unclassified Cobetia]MBK08329.1 transmembrane pair domain-containing protein [Cobetia sp.]MDH2299498.1 PACE efflux transporter [Cobetia sp. 29-18-1]BBO57759.1 membrane protein [Cobetia sp. AM6]HAR09482.1 transmembrane pair domain-containing protein [Cobetia sp.]HBJ28825.1 transmembrane pair domain-containing protein [Cobetia sp.]|tara:strand:+ start:22151 stop:22600 length:450 start_codon:yes stop_codon:yes gene_type:complete